MSKPLLVEVINFGDELLVGIRENAHLTYLGEQLAQYGLPIQRARIITDDREEIRTAFRDAWEHSDVVITTGGLGPTADDLTRETIAEALGAEMVFDPAIEVAIQQRFRALGRPMAKHHEKQCYRFKEGVVLANDRGTAPGLVYQANGKQLIMLPGPAHELQPMFEGQVLGLLQAEGILSEEPAYLQMRTCGVGESTVEERMQPLLGAHPDLQIAYCVHYGIVDVRFASKSGELSAAALKGIAQEARRIMGEDFVCFGTCSLARVVYKELRALDRTLALAESCTGGALSDAFTNISGVSKAFVGGIICYTNDVKVSQLGVPESIIEQHGAVSPECAVAMASGAAERLSADYALSVTGFAGPDGGNKDNPVGTIHIGYHSPVGVWCKTVRYTGGRMDVKARAVHAALDWMRRKLRKYKIEEFLSVGERD
ncbi:CinA family nicotinamide mononucleotide deamidase-related protein [Coraliomargarita akajimensis]|uniref:CinA-like protein n=1 Tax=Coraliomargarita akajimensis (strain DSM 45221 / IAM 15411 / JCM 23193 / KCTC 12865 / 04OKA010-24) TaxID=583355 RepID=D5EMT5_CORAD|nr:CinA family nicotinamide mononucleotide deamidase-related protein [Coraliomargarita akajimensis]ADE55325.1 competence/damage-inducible protein CinA [Coraliomargarita akajimensis DSM 45221]